MSERASFVTEHIDCAKCLVVAKRHLAPEPRSASLCSIQLPGWDITTPFLPIIAGSLAVPLWTLDSFHHFEKAIAPALKRELCHDLRIAIINEHGQRFYCVQPDSPA